MGSDAAGMVQSGRDQSTVLKRDHRWRHVDLGEYTTVYDTVVAARARIRTKNDLQSMRVSHESFSNHRRTLAKTDRNSAYDFNQWFATDKCMIRIADATQLTEPIGISHTIARRGSMVTQVVVEVGTNARASFVDNTLAPGTTFINRSTHLTVGAGSTVTYFLHNHASSDHFETVTIFCAAGSRVKLVTCTTGASLGHIEMNIHLVGPDSQADIGAVCLPSRSGQAVLHTLQHHEAPHTTSDLDARSVLVDHTKALYNGFIKINRTVVGANAYQKNSNVLLSGFAKAFSVPNLEIEANDVRCTHGSVTSGLSEEELFYAASRGLPVNQARRLITAAFFDPVVARLEDATIEQYARRLIHKTIRSILP